MPTSYRYIGYAAYAEYRTYRYNLGCGERLLSPGKKRNSGVLTFRFVPRGAYA